MRFREVFEKLKETASRNPRAAFITILVVLVVGVFLVSAALPSPPTPSNNPAPSQQARKQSPAGTEQQQIKAITNGPVEAQVFGENGMTDTTLGGALPTSAGVKIATEQGESAWGHSSSDADYFSTKSATVSWPLGGKYSRIKFTIGFLPGDNDVRPGAKYEFFIDGRKVWEKTITADDAAMGKAADATLSFGLSKAKVLTLRIASTMYKDTSFVSDYYRPTVPYPVVLYDIKLTEAGGGEN